MLFRGHLVQRQKGGARRSAGGLLANNEEIEKNKGKNHMKMHHLGIHKSWLDFSTPRLE